MPRISRVDPATANGRAAELIQDIEGRVGMVPNILLTMARAPAALEAYLGMSGPLAEGALEDETREAVALALAEVNDCEYCRAAHTAKGRRMGLSRDETLEARRGRSGDAKTQAAITFALRLNETLGHIGDEDLEAVRAAGYDDGEIVEIVANVALNLFTNIFNHVAETSVDFPKVPPLADYSSARGS